MGQRGATLSASSRRWVLFRRVYVPMWLYNHFHRGSILPCNTHLHTYLHVHRYVNVYEHVYIHITFSLHVSSVNKAIPLFGYIYGYACFNPFHILNLTDTYAFTISFFPVGFYIDFWRPAFIRNARTKHHTELSPAQRPAAPPLSPAPLLPERHCSVPLRTRRPPCNAFIKSFLRTRAHDPPARGKVGSIFANHEYTFFITIYCFYRIFAGPGSTRHSIVIPSRPPPFTLASRGFDTVPPVQLLTCRASVRRINLF